MARVEKYTRANMNVCTKEFGENFDEYLIEKKLDRIHTHARANANMFMKILSSISRKIVHEMIYNNYTFNLPRRVGNLSVVIMEPPKHNNRRMINWGETNKLWARNPQAKIDKKIVYYLNDHSNGNYAKFQFQKHYRCHSNVDLYSFIPSYANKKELGKAMLADKVERLRVVKKRFNYER